jgi:serine/threonine-protein kinase
MMPKLNAALAGRYTIVRELGRGGMATVYLATDVKHEREVAIKVLLPELAATIGADRFEREIRTAAKLQHPHILGMFDSGSADGMLYYVMPFVKGESVRDRIDREGMLPIEDALQITLEVNDALGYAHKQGIVHRDIKPENILLTGGHALVADFGIARAISDSGSDKKLTQTGMSMGTAYYMAPEQAAGETVGPTADLYALGCVLYEMLSGDPPFTGKNAMQIMARHAMEQVPSIRIVRSVVPEEIENAIFIAMNKTPADRPQNAEQFAQLLGMPIGNTATMRMMTPTMQRRVPSGAITAVQALRIKPWWQRPATIAGAVVLVAAALGAWQFLGRKKGAATTDPNARRLAVLYFDDRSRDSSLAPLAAGLTEGLIRSLSSAQSLTVISAGGVERYRGTTIGPDSIARALRVGYLVRGDLEAEGTQVRVNLQLVDASGATVSRKSFARPSGDAVAIRDTLAALASDLVRQEIRQEIEVRQQRAATGSATAWLLVQRGSQVRKRAEALSASGDSVGFDRTYREADSLFAAAEKEDGKWPEPIVMQASFAYRRGYISRSDPAQVRKWTTVAQDHANRALALDQDNPDALEFRGRAKYMAWLFAGESDAAKAKALLLSAKTDLEKATQLNASQAGAWAELSHLYNQAGSGAALTDVNIAAQRALAADEFLSNADVILARLFVSSYDLGQFDKAEQQCGEAERRFPAFQVAVRCQLFMLTTRNKTPDIAAAWRLADSTVARTPAPRRQLYRLNSDMYVAAVIARASKSQPALADSARHVAKRSEGDEKVDPTRDLALVGAFVYSLLNDRDNAIRLLKLYLASNSQIVETFRDDPGWWFRDLTPDPRFRQLVGGN